MNNWNILTECYIDTLLAEVVSSSRGCNHQHCCTKVLGIMKQKFLNNAALGIIDADKVTPKDLQEFSILKRHNNDEQLSIYKHEARSHYVIKIGKAAEDFILKNAGKCNILLSEYGLDSDLDGLKSVTKHVRSLKEAEVKLKKLFSTLKQNENSDFHKLAQWIELFKKDPYSLNEQLL